MSRQTEMRTKPSAGKRYPLNMRTTKAIRVALESAAALNGRSLAQEVEFRLERSFREDRIDDQLTAVAIRLEEALTVLARVENGQVSVCAMSRPLL